MDRFFDVNNPVMRFLSTSVDLAIVNLMTVLFAVPVITAGGSLASMNYVLLHLYRGEEGYLTSMFKKSFKENFRQGIPLGLLAVGICGITAADLFLLHSMNSKAATILMIIISVVSMYLITTFVYVFALQARYENTVTGTIANAFRLSIAHLPRTLGMMITWIVWILTLWYLHKAAPLVFLLYGFTLPGYICVSLYEPVFRKMENKVEEDQ
ncbi:MAG: DUF624 domain-containing protein [Eubacterium sp.]|nr:DUF624 domain-containing protein [Eubacterium sp.]